MDTEVTPTGSDRPPEIETELHAIASRAIRVALAIIQLMLAAVMVLAAASLTTISYALPAAPGTDVLPTTRVAWGPGIAAAVVAAMMLLACVGWLMWNARTRPRLLWWVLAIGVSVVDVVVVLGVSQLSTPTF